MKVDRFSQKQDGHSDALMDNFYLLMVCLLYGIIGAGQVLGFLGLYSPPLALAVSTALALLAGWQVRRSGAGDGGQMQPEGMGRSLTIALTGGALLLFALLVALPLLAWPASPVGRSLTWDAGAYHFPKAVELMRSGSVWDLSIPYGEYPFGYESLLAFVLALGGGVPLFGLVHAFTGLLFVLVVYLLGRRATRLPRALLLFLSVVLLAGGAALGGGRTWLFSGYALTVGKNDFLVGVLSLAVILHSPVVARRGEKPTFQLVPLALVSMLALSVKPNALAVVLPAWLLVLYVVLAGGLPKMTLADLWGRLKAQAVTLLVCFLFVLPGGLWAVRNLAALGVIYSPAVRHLQAESIASNLGNPNLYAINFQSLILLAVILVLLAAIVALRWRLVSAEVVGTLALLLAAFAVTPASAFHRDLNVPAHLAWRFGVALLAYAFLVLLMLLEPLLLHLLKWLRQQPGRLHAAALLILILCGVLLWRGRWIMAYEPQNEWILRDQFERAVGVDGYWSAYDYVQKNLRGAVIQVENGLVFLLYGPGYTNSPTRLQYPLEMAERVPQPVPEYYVIFRPDWQAEDPETGVFPAFLEQSDWQGQWALIYDDGEGRVYRRVKRPGH